MPIANCYLNNCSITNTKADAIANEWAGIINVDIKDVCLSFINIQYQAGRQYRCLSRLYLPSLWQQQQVEKIQMSLQQVLTRHLELKPAEIFIITSIINSGHVVEDGKIIHW
ncbi:MAG TPA: hypothetical protein PKC39_05280 [Ferruginibacter sp.]|nr:hypothetical protein [Ferruginibacter sp.]HMP20354.1 hypothetical protein [Ferruginibacter sp.]